MLVAALGLQGIRMRNVQRGDVTSPARPIGLGARLPATSPGWNVANLPLGATEFLSSEVAQTLNYDDHVYRTYSRGGDEVSVYVAYWSPGRMPVEKVASHTPDRCWSENGWNCTAYRFPATLQSPDGPLKPGYWRIFVPPNGGPKQYVIYWQLVGSELYDFGGGFNRRLSPIKWWRDMLHYAWKGSAAQYFIRVTSDRPFEELQGDPGFEEVLGALAKLGLAAR